MFTKTFWKDATERTLATVAQAALGVLTADGLGLLEVEWTQVASVAGMAGVLAVLKAIVASKRNDPDSASLVDIDPPGRHAVDRVV